MKTYKVVNRTQFQDVNDDGNQKFLAVKRGNGQLLAIPCWHIETQTIGDKLSFQDAKTMRVANKGSQIIIDEN